MARKPGGPVLGFARVDPAAPTPLYHQIYSELREAVLAGRLAAGARLPSTRSIAAELGISRRPVKEAFGHLVEEGLLEGRRGAGTFVASRLAHPAIGPGEAGPPAVSGAAVLSRRGAALAGTANFETRETGAFAPTLPAADQFPRALWARLHARHWRQAGSGAFRKAPPAGDPGLRAVLASHLRATRGLRCTPAQVIVTAGGTHAVGLLARLLLEPDEAAWTENPGWPTGRQVLRAHEVVTVPVPVDREGIVVEEGRRLAPRARLALVCPSRQYPLGMPMTLARRLALLDWAAEERAWIVEDDYDCEFQYTTRVQPSLQSLDRHGAVIYMGSLSKVLTQGLRLGYLVVPPALAGPVARALSHEKVVPTLVQAVVRDILAEGHFATHTRRMRQLYRRRQATLVEELRVRFGDTVRVSVTDSGFHLIARLPPGTDEAAVSCAAAAHGVFVPGLAGYYHPDETGLRPDPALVLGFACTPEPEIVRGLEGLAAALRNV